MTTVSRFPLLGEPLALDLVNTRVRRRGSVVDLLDRSAALDDWLRAQRARVDWSGRARATDLAAVRTLRDALDQLLRASRRRGPPPAAAVRTLNGILSAPVPQPRLRWTPAGPRRSPPRARAGRANLLRQLALDAFDLLTGAEATLVRQCAHPGCILLFVARHPRRRWCSSATCGNRARVSRHYAREHGQP